MNTTRIALTVNGQALEAEVEARTLLVEFLREHCGLRGAHVGCDTSQCGCCTVEVDGSMVKSCSMLAAQADGTRVATIESLADGETLHPVQQAFHECHALQCGFCTPGMVMACVGLLRREPAPDREAIVRGLEGNLCRCTGYVSIVRAVDLAARRMRGE
ncbi:MAG TPA: (2Fe-2S)-binding protein [Ramlibacter sp.]|nr:(2Fe-2S)-binding protein [Ramlibacter sp.]